jgi:hypothetical protein
MRYSKENTGISTTVTATTTTVAVIVLIHSHVPLKSQSQTLALRHAMPLVVVVVRWHHGQRTHEDGGTYDGGTWLWDGYPMLQWSL